jgi:hypothetical protein
MPFSIDVAARAADRLGAGLLLRMMCQALKSDNITAAWEAGTQTARIPARRTPIMLNGTEIRPFLRFTGPLIPALQGHGIR